jgi:flagellar hook assembly protein FlgD
MGENILHIEAWDSANNRSEFQIDINIQKTDIFQAYQVYAVPNPFSETTHFTFWVSEGESPHVTINIFNPNGVKVKQLKQNCIAGFNAIQWDGRSESDEDIANGPYIYHLKAKSDGHIFEKLFKVAKLK